MPPWRKSYTLRHFEGQTIVDGYATAAYTDSVVRLDIQPLSTKELEVLPEGERSKNRVKAFGSSPIQAADDEKGVRADLIFYMGKWYKCEVSEPWRGGMLDHYASQFVCLPDQEAEEEPENLVPEDTPPGGSGSTPGDSSMPDVNPSKPSTGGVGIRI